MKYNYKNSETFENVFAELYDSPEKLREFMDVAFAGYLETGDLNSFCKSLELSIKAQDSIENFAKKADVSKSGLYDIIKRRREPKLKTLNKILKQLGLEMTLKSA